MNVFLEKHADKFIPEPNTGCYLWTGAEANGYGVVMTPRGEGKRRQLKAHRCSYEAENGPLLPDADACHHCDQTFCVNPDHVYAGTPATNGADKARRGRAHRPKGQSNPKAKLSPDDVAEIRLLYFGNGTGKRGNAGKLARRFGVTVTTIQRVAKMEAWH